MSGKLSTSILFKECQQITGMRKAAGERDNPLRDIAFRHVPMRDLSMTDSDLVALQLLRLSFDYTKAGRDTEFANLFRFADRKCGPEVGTLLASQAIALCCAVIATRNQMPETLPVPCRCVSGFEKALVKMWSAYRDKNPKKFVEASSELSGGNQSRAIIELSTKLIASIDRICGPANFTSSKCYRH